MNLPNCVSLLRIPLALCLFYPDTKVRISILGIALLTDGLDGFLARYLKKETWLGAILDPLTDKIFVIMALLICFRESTLQLWQIGAFFCRDSALFIITLRAYFSGSLWSHPVTSIWPGKVTTVLQFGTLALLIQGITPPTFVWFTYIALGVLFFAGLINNARKRSIN